MDAYAALTQNSGLFRESVFGVAALKGDGASLTGDGGIGIDHIFQSVDTRVYRFLLNNRSALSDGTALACAIHIDRIAADDNSSTAFQHTALVHVTDDNLRGRDDDTFVVGNIPAAVQMVEYVGLHLLHGILLLMYLFQVF